MKSGNLNFLEPSEPLQTSNGTALFIHIKRLVLNEIFSSSNTINREVGQAKDLSAPLYLLQKVKKY
jgi:hypothetical protein